jgi:DNA-binding transcriptional regulator GbsR (MarR family)
MKERLRTKNWGWKRIVPLIYGQQLPEVLLSLYQRHRTVSGVANELGVSRQSIYLALRELGMTLGQRSN